MLPVKLEKHKYLPMIINVLTRTRLVTVSSSYLNNHACIVVLSFWRSFYTNDNTVHNLNQWFKLQLNEWMLNTINKHCLFCQLWEFCRFFHNAHLDEDAGGEETAQQMVGDVGEAQQVDVEHRQALITSHQGVEIVHHFLLCTWQNPQSHLHTHTHRAWLHFGPRLTELSEHPEKCLTSSNISKTDCMCVPLDQNSSAKSLPVSATGFNNENQEGLTPVILYPELEQRKGFAGITFAF